MYYKIALNRRRSPTLPNFLSSCHHGREKTRLRQSQQLTLASANLWQQKSCSNPHSYPRPIHPFLHDRANLLVGGDERQQPQRQLGPGSWHIQRGKPFKTSHSGQPVQPFHSSRPCQDWPSCRQPLRRWLLISLFTSTRSKDWLSKLSFPPSLPLPQLLPLATISS